MPSDAIEAVANADQVEVVQCHGIPVELCVKFGESRHMLVVAVDHQISGAYWFCDDLVPDRKKSRPLPILTALVERFGYEVRLPGQRGHLIHGVKVNGPSVSPEVTVNVNELALLHSVPVRVGDGCVAVMTFALNQAKYQPYARRSVVE